MKTLFKFVLNAITERLTQSSTWVGIFALLSTGGLTIAPEMTTNLVACLSGAFGAYQVYKTDKKNKK